MRRLVLAVALGVCLPPRASAQDKVAALTYTISFPGSTTAEFIDETSFRGVELVARATPWYRSPILVGLTLGWQVFNFETSEPIELESGTVSGTQRRFLNAVPILLTGHYYLGTRDSWRALVGLGVGTIYTLQTFEIGVYSFEQGTWQLGLAPEAGLQYPVSTATDFYLTARYNYAFERGESLDGEAQAWDYWSLNVGFAWSNW